MERPTEQPQTEREWMFRLSEQLGHLTSSIDKLGDRLADIEKIQIAEMTKRINTIDVWKQQITGGWKLVVIIFSILTAVGAGAIIKIFQMLGR